MKVKNLADCSFAVDRKYKKMRNERRKKNLLHPFPLALHVFFKNEQSQSQ